MNILDENIREDQRQRLRGWRMTAHQIGWDIGRKGMKDKRLPCLCGLSCAIPLLIQKPSGWGLWFASFIPACMCGASMPHEIRVEWSDIQANR